MDLEKQKLNRHDSAAGAFGASPVATPASTAKSAGHEVASTFGAGPVGATEGAFGETGTMSLGDCFDGFFWKIINDFCWSYKDILSWEDFYNHINVKIVNFPYSQNVMNMLYNFITAKTDLLYSKLFPGFIKSQTCAGHFGAGAFDIDFVLIRSILEEITSLGKNHYEAATADLVYNMYIYDKYTIPGGLCKVFTTFNNTKILRCEHIPTQSAEDAVSEVASRTAAGPEGAPVACVAYDSDPE
jgi:hypothetical protein